MSDTSTTLPTPTNCYDYEEYISDLKTCLTPTAWGENETNIRQNTLASLSEDVKPGEEEDVLITSVYDKTFVGIPKDTQMLTNIKEYINKIQFNRDLFLLTQGECQCFVINLDIDDESEIFTSETLNQMIFDDLPGKFNIVDCDTGTSEKVEVNNFLEVPDFLPTNYEYISVKAASKSIMGRIDIIDNKDEYESYKPGVSSYTIDKLSFFNKTSLASVSAFSSAAVAYSKVSSMTDFDTYESRFETEKGDCMEDEFLVARDSLASDSDTVTTRHYIAYKGMCQAKVKLTWGPCVNDLYACYYYAYACYNNISSYITNSMAGILAPYTIYQLKSSYIKASTSSISYSESSSTSYIINNSFYLQYLDTLVNSVRDNVLKNNINTYYNIYPHFINENKLVYTPSSSASTGSTTYDYTDLDIIKTYVTTAYSDYSYIKYNASLILSFISMYTPVNICFTSDLFTCLHTMIAIIGGYLDSKGEIYNDIKSKSKEDFINTENINHYDDCDAYIEGENIGFECDIDEVFAALESTYPNNTYFKDYECECTGGVHYHPWLGTDYTYAYCNTEFSTSNTKSVNVTSNKDNDTLYCPTIGLYISANSKLLYLNTLYSTTATNYTISNNTTQTFTIAKKHTETIGCYITVNSDLNVYECCLEDCITNNTGSSFSLYTMVDDTTTCNTITSTSIYSLSLFDGIYLTSSGSVYHNTVDSNGDMTSDDNIIFNQLVSPTSSCGYSTFSDRIYRLNSNCDYNYFAWDATTCWTSSDYDECWSGDLDTTETLEDISYTATFTDTETYFFNDSDSSTTLPQPKQLTEFIDGSECYVRTVPECEYLLIAKV